ncbi:hypothetical protein WBG25_07500 [Xylella fastidiosa subsp. multiplex]|uniref:hypothetical protein n=1 Tax=Xylella fastidiosa TaxID=2371 RepID=UPI00372C6CCF
MSLTTVRRCGTVAAKEPKNSELGGTRTRNPCGFFYACTFLRREGGSDTTPARGKLPAVRVRFLSLPTPTGAAPKNVSPVFFS